MGLLLFLGMFLWVSYHLYRIILLYAAFSLAIFWATNNYGTRHNFQVLESSGTKWLIVPVFTLLALCIAVTSCSLYLRPSELPPLLALAIAILVIVLATARDSDNSFFLNSYLLLFVVVAMVLFINFSIYLAQPNLANGPTYASPDAYRDYANAYRIIQAAQFQPNMMIQESFYRTFPVVPLSIAITSIITGLPVELALFLLSLGYQILGVVSLVLLSRAIIGTSRQSRYPPVALIPVLVVMVQPLLIEPVFLLTPLSDSVALVSLICYLSYGKLVSGRQIDLRTFLLIVLLMYAAISLHPASAILSVVFIVSLALLGARKESDLGSSLITLTLVSFIALVLYVVTLVGSQSSSVFSNISALINGLKTIVSTGPSIGTAIQMASQAGAGPEISANSTELQSFLQALGPTLALSLCTVFLFRAVFDKGGFLRKQGLRLLNTWFAILLLLVFAGGYLLQFLGLFDVRYLELPLTPVLLIAISILLLRALQDPRLVKRMVLVGLLLFYIVCSVGSPLFLHETYAGYARLTPTNSEKDAAAFLAVRFSNQTKLTFGYVQIVADWPYYNVVSGMLYSRQHVENYAKVRYLLNGDRIKNGYESIVFSRSYFFESAYLQDLTPLTHPLEDNSTFANPGVNRIFDDSSTAIYIGLLEF